MSWSDVSTVHVPGGSFDAFVALPARTPAPGVVVLQEIFGVNSYVEDVCQRIADLGYVAMAPDVFWRFGPHIRLEGRAPEVVAQAMKYGKQLDMEAATADVLAAMDVLRDRAEVSGRIGLLGFCMGGTLAFLAAARGDPGVCISYYGAGVAGAISQIADVTCPVLFHFGEVDPVISEARVEQVRDGAAHRPDVSINVYGGAGHAFDNHRDEDGFHAASSAAAWTANEELLRATLRS